MKRILLAGLALVSAATAANSATVTNGTFDDSTAAQPTFTNNAGVNLNLTSNYGATPDGVNSGYINSSWNIFTGSSVNGAMTFQLAGLVVGQNYLINFLDASPTGLAANAVSVMYNGTTSLGSFAPTSTSWTSNTTSAFTATGASGTVSFTGGNVAAFGATRGIGIDGVSISAAAVPEPASWAMMVGGFGILGAALRRRQPANAAVTFG